MKSADQALIMIAALIFTGFGLWFLFVLLAAAQAGTSTYYGVTARASYGGFELGVAAFLLWCAFREDWRHIGLIAATLFIAGLGLGRGAGILLEGGATGLVWFFLGIEVTYTACALWRLTHTAES